LPEPDVYLIGRSAGEEERLKRQIADLAPDSDAQFEKIGIKPGEGSPILDAAREAFFISWASASVRPVRFSASTAALISSNRRDIS
jgi:hypothetical protein